MRKYNTLIIDVMNVAYRVFNHKNEAPTHVAKKQVFRHAVANFIKTISQLRETYLHSDGHIYLLFDNPTSRVDLQTSFYFASRKQAYAKYKEKRSREPKEFYNSIGLLKYYYLLLDESYHTIQITNLEADDLVKPLVASLNTASEYHLMVSNDLDWARNLTSNVHWLQQFSGEPDTPETISQHLGFRVTEETLIAYKAIFGDTADDIPAIAGAKLQPYFTAFAEEITTADDAVRFATSDKMIAIYPFLQAVRDNTRQFRINLQLVREIPVAERHLAATTSTGRGAVKVQTAVEKALGIRESNVFTFGDIKRPRVEGLL